MKFIQTFPFKPQGAADIGMSVCCTPDGILYIGNRSVNFVKACAANPLIRTFNTKQQIIAIDVDPCWNYEGKFFATLTNEKSILIWDFDKGVAVSGHKAHSTKAVEGAEKSNSAVYMGFLKNRNLLSLCSNDLVVYCLASNSTCVRPKFAPGKGQVLTALKCSPYNEHIFALGTNRGQVYICDLQKMAVVYTLGRHQTPIASLSWNLIDIPAETPKSANKAKPPLVLNNAVEENDDIFNIYDYDYLENEFGAPMKTNAAQETKNNAEANEVNLNPNFNFQEACESLKQEINALNNEKNDGAVETISSCDAVTLEDCRSSNNAACPSSACDSESTEGSLDLVEQSSSSDESCHVDGRDLKPRKQSFEKERECNKKELEAGTMPEKMEREIANNVEKKDILLASASTDCQIWIWNADTGGCCENLKGVVTRKNFKLNYTVHVIWRNSTELYAIDPQGEIMKWVLSPSTSTSVNSRRTYKFERTPNFRTEQRALAFGISKDLDFLWYISPKIELVCQSIESAETILHYATATSNIRMATESPENNSKIAFAFTDRRIALLETSQLSQTRIFIRFLQVKLNNFVAALAWSDDGCNIAYGTIDGQAGYVNIDSEKHVTFHTIYGKPVYSIAWLGEVIFLTCNDKLLAYNMRSRDPLSLEGVKTPVSSVSVKHNYIFLGTARGYIVIYRKKEVESTPDPGSMSLEQIQSVEVAKHYITGIAWNPIKKDEFAVAANEANVNILSFDVNEHTASIIRKIDLNKPKCTISTVKWSNRDPNKLVTCGFDGALRVFDLSRESKEELIFTKQFNCPLYSAMLLPRDEQYALCTGRSITVEIVDTGCSDNVTHSHKNEGTLDNIKWAAKMNIGNAATGNKRKDKVAAKKVTAQAENTFANELTEKIAELAIEQTNKTPDKQGAQQNSSNSLKNPQTLMHLITKEHNKNPLERLLIWLDPKSPKKGKESVLVSKLFGSKKDVENVLCAELEKVKTQTTAAEIGISFLSQVKGDIRDVILKAIQSRQLSETHIALAPTVSYSFWQKCCRAYAEQLLEQGYALQAATYMLRIHNQREAINMLISANFFKEALLIARVYLLKNDPLVDEITNKWIEQLENHGNLPGAALVCAVSKQYMRGYEILSKQRVIGPEETAVINLLKEKAAA